jgi:uncharacterized membrane protein YphA (DoxX/SURF4 family)
MPQRDGQTVLSGAPSDRQAVSADTVRRLSRGIAAIRILIGGTFLSNGLAKLFEFDRIRVGWYAANLIDRADARFILNAEVNHNARHRVWLVSRITNHLLLPHWVSVQWALTAAEVAAGTLLVIGLWSRLGALIALVPTVFLFAMYFANNRWLPEQPLELVPLVVLGVVPSGIAWGVDGHLRRRAWPS